MPSSNQIHDKGVRSVLRHCWDLGVTGFGGPNVQFLIFHERFVKKLRWLDERVYQELFALNVGTPGSASTGLLFSIVLVRHGTLCAILAFFLWSLPGALGMLVIALGISHVQTVLPRVVYALLSGLNSAIVGLIAMAGVQLAQRAITNQMTRLVICVSSCVAMLYRSLWYYPSLLIIAGIVVAIYDSKIVQQIYGRVGKLFKRQGTPEEIPETKSEPKIEEIVMEEVKEPTSPEKKDVESGDVELCELEFDNLIPFSAGTTALVLTIFLVTFGVIMSVRAFIPNLPPVFKFFSNIFLAGTIICGGGPVVIPLLSDYVVESGFVSGRNFLIGLALIQSFPGPNFNFVVYLGVLSTGVNPIAGALLAFLGMYAPGLIIKYSILGIWQSFRTKPLLSSFLKGVECGAVGLVFAAVYRLWIIGIIDLKFQNGSPIDGDPWFVLISAAAFSASKWYGVKPPVAILSGGLLGMLWFALVGHRAKIFLPPSS